MPQSLKPYPKVLWFLIVAYTSVILLANWFDARLVTLFGLDTDAGTLIFPLTFLLSDMITEVYGYKHTRRAIWCGFLFNLVFIGFGQLVIHMPSPEYATQNTHFDTLLTLNTRIIIASTLSYLIAEPINAYILATLKLKLTGKWMGFRFIFSTFIASGLDSIAFGIIAFYKVIPNSGLISLILGMWFLKVLIELIGLPISIPLTHKLKSYECSDMYDKKTSFTLFSLDANYNQSENKFKR